MWYSPDLETGTSHFAGLLGSAPVFGGVHPGEGTRNSLLSLGPVTYLEVLARDPAQKEAGTFGRELAELESQGLYHWAIAGVDLETLIERARRLSLECGGVISGGRHGPDGGKLSWRLAGLRNHEFGALIPFFIDWGACEHPASRAPSGGRLIAVEIVSPAPQQLLQIFAALGLDFNVVEGPAPRLTAVLEGGSGTHRLNSIDPLPKGFEIR